MPKPQDGDTKKRSECVGGPWCVKVTKKNVELDLGEEFDGGLVYAYLCIYKRYD